MTEEATPKVEPKAKKEKPPAIEDKPFNEFMEQHFTPALEQALAKEGIKDVELNLVKEKLPLRGADNQEYWQIKGNWNQKKRQFNIYFPEANINGPKYFSSATNGGSSSDLESFMIDERKVTLDLMLLYTLQRLNAQKWLTKN